MWIATFVRIAVCNWPTSRISDATHLMADLCVVRVTSNAYRIRNREHHNRCPLAISLWAKCIFKLLVFSTHNNHPIMKIYQVEWKNRSNIPEFYRIRTCVRAHIYTPLYTLRAIFIVWSWVWCMGSLETSSNLNDGVNRVSRSWI